MLFTTTIYVIVQIGKIFQSKKPEIAVYYLTEAMKTVGSSLTFHITCMLLLCLISPCAKIVEILKKSLYNGQPEIVYNYKHWSFFQTTSYGVWVVDALSCRV